MLATIIFWGVMIVVAAYVFYKMANRVAYNVAGFQKISGKWVQTMYPDHYTFFGTYLAYVVGAVLIIALVYGVLASILYVTEIDAKLKIWTGLQNL